MKFNEQPLKKLNLDESKKIELSPEDEGSSLESKKVSLRIEIEGEENNLEAKSYYFEYPKNIQESTGIIGYTRTKVNEEQFKNILNQGDILEKTTQRYKPYALKELDEIQNEFTRELRLKVAENLSHNEYPYKTYNHKMGTYTGKNGSRYIEQFKNDKFFLQKLFGLDTIESLSKNHDYAYRNGRANNAGVFSHGPGYEQGSISSNKIDIFDKKTNKLTKTEVLPSRVSEYIDENHYAISNPLNMNLGKFWYTKSFTLGTEPTFGFKLENFHKEYVEKCLESIASSDTDNSGQILPLVKGLIYNELLNSDLYDKIRDLYIKKPELFNRGAEKTDSEKEVFNNLYDYQTNLVEKYREKYKNVLNRFEGKFHGDPLKSETNLDWVVKGDMELEDSPFPIFINHDEILQLSWGHAKYAHYVDTQGNFNFFEFKHVDHLPNLKS